MKNQKELQTAKEKLKSLQKEKEQLVRLAAETLIESFKEHPEEDVNVKTITIYYDFKDNAFKNLISVSNGVKSYEFGRDK